MKVTETQHEFGYVRDEKIYLKGFLGFADRQIGQVKETEEASIKYFEDRFQIAQQKVLDLKELIEKAQNKGSYLMKLVHMRKYLANFDGLGDYTTLFAHLDEMEKYLRSMIAVNRVKNYEIKEALIKDAHIAYENENLQQASEDLKEIKLKWIKTGAVLRERQEDIEQRFKDLCRDFYERRKDIIKQRTKQAKENLRQYRDIINAAEDLKTSDNFEETFEKFRQMQQDWKKCGKIPHKKAVRVWESFKAANDIFFTRYKKFKSYKEEYPDLSAEDIKNKLQFGMADEAEALVNYDQAPDTDRAKELLMEWKKLSGTFRNLSRDHYERFRFACDKIFELNYLIRVVLRKYPDLETKPELDRLRIKTSFMRELIRRDEHEMNLTEANLDKMNRKRRNNFKALKGLQNNLNIQKRKISVKKQILQKFESDLNALK